MLVTTPDLARCSDTHKIPIVHSIAPDWQAWCKLHAV